MAERYNTQNRWGDSRRFYQTPNGDYPSVTTILQVIAKPALVRWSANTERALVMGAAADLWDDYTPGEKKWSRSAYVTTLKARLTRVRAHEKLSAQACNIGTDAHKLIEWFLRKELGQKQPSQPKVSQEALTAANAWGEWRMAQKLKPLKLEQTIWSDAHRFAGTADIICEVVPPGMSESVIAIGDWKTSKALYPESGLQIAAYAKAASELGLVQGPVHGFVLRLPKAKTDPGFEAKHYTPEQLSNLFETFLHAYRLWEWTVNEESKS